ncbi:MAG: FHA domain-containing protein [Planctomycetota bacterium]
MKTPFGELIPKGGGDVIPLLADRLLVGRRPDCDVALTFPNVSSRHCELAFEDGYWRVRDLGSSNGTKVDEERVYGDTWLAPGATLTIARKHHYEIRYNADPLGLPESDATPERSPLAQAGLEPDGPARRSRR